jgi:hypothetical protein
MSENSQDYAQTPQRNCAFINPASEQIIKNSGESMRYSYGYTCVPIWTFEKRYINTLQVLSVHFVFMITEK